MADITPMLQAERDALSAFITLLETEQQALVSGNTEQLLPLSESKVLAVQELGKLASLRRDELLARTGKEEPGGMTAWLQANAANVLPIWQDIQHLAEQAQQLNRTNGILIQTKLRHNQQALVALQGAAQNTSSLYGPDGQHNLPTSGRILGSV